MKTPKSQKLDIIIPAYRMHSQNFLNVLDGISEEAALKRIDDKTNHVVWMAGNYVNTRYGMGQVLGLDRKDPYEDLFFQAKALDPTIQYPTLEELIVNFKEVSPLVYQRLLEVTDQELEQDFPIGMGIPFVKEDVLNFVGMCIGRADYLCGQMGLMRKLLGLPGMKYDLIPNLDY